MAIRFSIVGLRSGLFNTLKSANEARRKCALARGLLHKPIDIGSSIGPLCVGTVKSTRFAGGQHYLLTLGHGVEEALNIYCIEQTINSKD